MGIVLKLKRFRKPTFIGLKSVTGCTTYLTSKLISGASHEYLNSSYKPVFIDSNYRCGLHLKLKELLYSQKYSHWPRVLYYCCLLFVASVGTTSEQNRSRIGCHNNFSKAKDAFSRVRDRFWNMMSYLNVFSLPPLKDVVGYFKLWMR